MDCCPGGWDNGHAYWCAESKRKPVEAKSIRVTRLDPEGRLTGDTEVVSGSVELSLEGTDEDWGAGPFLPTGPISMDVTLAEPDPALLALLTGEVPLTPPNHQLELWQKVYHRRRAWRVVWDWLCRRERAYSWAYYLFPNVRVSQKPEGD